MSRPGLELRRADVDCLDEILAILNAAASWLRSKGVRQWPDRFNADDVLTAILQGETWLARLDGDAAGTITVNWSDALWDSTTQDAGYVHRLAVVRSSPGLGRRLLEWAADTVLLHDRDLLRLDCVATNRPLRAYYEAAGFQYRGDVRVLHPKLLGRDDAGFGSHSLYELKLDRARRRRCISVTKA